MHSPHLIVNEVWLNYPPPHEEERHFQKEIAFISKNSLVYILKKNFSFQELIANDPEFLYQKENYELLGDLIKIERQKKVIYFSERSLGSFSISTLTYRHLISNFPFLEGCFNPLTSSIQTFIDALKIKEIKEDFLLSPLIEFGENPLREMKPSDKKIKDFRKHLPPLESSSLKASNPERFFLLELSS